ncbi:MAG: SDR family oxidoreductase [Parvularculaceae bacterium]
MAIALITGGNRGLGRNAAIHLAGRGVDVIFTWRGNESEAKDVVAEIEAAGVRGAALQLDVSKCETFAAFASAVRDVLKKWGAAKFDYLLNNAGAGGLTMFADTTQAQLDEMYAIHLRGPFMLTQTMLPLIANGGRILNVSSGLARFSLPGYSAYAVMKGAIDVLTRYQARELGERGIAVNSIAPGAIETDFGGGGVRDNPEINAAIAAQTPLGRVGVPDDIGPLIAALFSGDCRWVNGQRIEASGGIFA